MVLLSVSLRGDLPLLLEAVAGEMGEVEADMVVWNQG